MKHILKNIVTWMISICIAFLIVVLLKAFVGMPTTIKGTSMFPTLSSGEKVLLSTWGAFFHNTPKRGDCITFEAPSVELITDVDNDNPVAIYNTEKNAVEKFFYYGLGITKSSYIKRVVGLPGDHVEIKKDRVYVNGEQYNEPYVSRALKTDMSLGGEFDDVIVPEGYVYVLGDNRAASADSRRFGCIPIDKIEGKVWIRWWPLKKFGKL